MNACLVPVTVATSMPILSAGLTSIVNSFDKFEVFSCLCHENELKSLLYQNLPGNLIMIADGDMITNNNRRLLKDIKDRFPSVRIIALSSPDASLHLLSILDTDDVTVLPLNVKAADLYTALKEINANGIYRTCKKNADTIKLTNKEKVLMKHICSNLTYKEIASLMGVSQRTVETHRDHLFHKFNVNSRSALVVQSIKFGLDKLQQAG